MFASRGPSKGCSAREEADPSPSAGRGGTGRSPAAATPMDAPKASSAMRPMKPMAKKADRAARDEGGMDGMASAMPLAAAALGWSAAAQAGRHREGTIGLGNLGTIGRGGGSADKKMARAASSVARASSTTTRHPTPAR